MKYKYGEFRQSQINQTKWNFRKQIYFLLLIVDRNTSGEYPDVDPESAFNNLLYKIDGFNEILGYPPEMVTVASLLAEALKVLKTEPFRFLTYRKLILDAGSEVMKIKEV